MKTWAVVKVTSGDKDNPHEHEGKVGTVRSHTPEGVNLVKLDDAPDLVAVQDANLVKLGDV